jgi:hypothetical protein
MKAHPAQCTAQELPTGSSSVGTCTLPNHIRLVAELIRATWAAHVEVVSEDAAGVDFVPGEHLCTNDSGNKMLYVPLDSAKGLSWIIVEFPVLRVRIPCERQRC